MFQCRESLCPAICRCRFTDAAEDRMPLVEDGEAGSVISVEKKKRTAREAVAAADVAADSSNVSQLIERLMNGYDKRLRPNYKGQPTRRLFRCLSSTLATGPVLRLRHNIAKNIVKNMNVECTKIHSTFSLSLMYNKKAGYRKRIAGPPMWSYWKKI